MIYPYNFTDGNGRKYSVALDVRDPRKAALTLANRAIANGSKQATALDGAIVLTLTELPK